MIFFIPGVTVRQRPILLTGPCIHFFEGQKKKMEQIDRCGWLWATQKFSKKFSHVDWKVPLPATPEILSSYACSDWQSDTEKSPVTLKGKSPKWWLDLETLQMELGKKWGGGILRMSRWLLLQCLRERKKAFSGPKASFWACRPIMGWAHTWRNNK